MSIIGGTFVLAITDSDTDHPMFKVRFVALGYRDTAKDFLVHTTETFLQTAICILC